MKVLGLGTEGDGGAAVVEDGRVLSAINEERLCRMKLVVGFPRQAIKTALKLANSEIGELDAVIIGGKYDLLADELEPFDGWFQNAPAGIGGLMKTYGASTFSRFRKWVPPLELAYYAMLGPTFSHRRKALQRILREEFDVRCPIVFVDHHFAHLTSAYFTSGFKNALAVSVDGGGDKKSGLVYEVRDGHFKKLHEVSAYDSLGNYYAYITHLCGFKAMKHEGKVTGLAAHGEPKYVPLLEKLIQEQDGSLINRAGVVHRAAIRKIERQLPAGWTREDLAASIQEHCEDLTKRFVSFWQRRTGLTDMALAGGVFANVRVNQEVHSLDGVERLFVHPHMGDGGLCVGAALAACVPGILDTTMPTQNEPLRDVNLGTDLTDSEIARALQDHGLEPQQLDGPLEEEIAELLVAGHVVARAAGRMEYGPRALGNRSILYQPTDKDVNTWLNENLHRTEFMPFAPATLYEECDKCFEHTSGGKHAAEFMTITFDCTPWMQEHMKGVVHVDNTARPQLVRRDRNPGFYKIIEEFHKRTGLPAVINTSFNMHEEPIVCSADDCVRAFLDGNLDYLAIGTQLIKHPRDVNHPMKAVRRLEQFQAD